jgi:hypothetical protein
VGVRPVPSSIGWLGPRPWLSGRVENRRSDFSLSVAVGLGFRLARRNPVWPGSGSYPAHRTGQAELPHPALGKDARLSV